MTPSLPPSSLRRLGFVVAALLPLLADAQLQWTVSNEATLAAAPAANDRSGVTLTVPAGQRATLFAGNFQPVDFSAAASGEVYVTLTFKASGGLSNLAGGTRAIGYGLFNHGGTADTFADDRGYFTWLNGRQTGSLIELRRRTGDGTSPSLLNPTGSAFTSLGTGTTTQSVGALTDGGTYSLQLHLIRTATGISLGNTSSTTTGAGVWLSGEGLSQTAYTNPDVPPVTTVFNQVGFMFLNTTAAPVTLEIISVTGLTPLNPPAIVAAPAPLVLNPSQAGTLSVVATGTEPLAYQWRRDGAVVAGATSATLTLPSVSSVDAGSYVVTVSNAYGSSSSAPATLTVTTTAIPPTITVPPAALTVTAGQDAAFAVAAYGSAPVSYQWRRNDVNLPGATAATLSLRAVTPADAGAYSVVVTNAAGSVSSADAPLTVNSPPAITVPPVGATVAAGVPVTFSVVASGSPAPTYQWSRNGSAIPGATAASYSLPAAGLADTGVYTVRIVNAIGAVTSAPAVLAIPSAMAVTSVSPANGAVNVNPDTPLRVTFDRAPAVGIAGRIRIIRASDQAVVDTIDLGAPFQLRTVGTNPTPLNYQPVIVSGNSADIYPHAGVLAYGESYHVVLEPGTFRDASGASFTGRSDPDSWRFTTKAAGPAAGATLLTVAADGSGDFNTVQGAVDFVPANNARRVVIAVRPGTYPEQVYVGSNRPLVTVRGEDRARTIITYRNNNNLNGSTRTRGVFTAQANDFTLESLTIVNSTPQGGSQAEAFVCDGQRVLLDRVRLVSRQDTLLCSTGTAFLTDCTIEGNTDFIWGSAAAYFQRCELRALDTAGQEGYYTQVRNGQVQVGFVFVDCVLSGEATAARYYLGRIDPTSGGFPYSQAVWINCAMGSHVLPVGWQLNNAATSATVRNWEFQSTDLNGASLDVTRRHPSSRQIDAATAATYRDPAYVLGGWSPQVAPTIGVPPSSVTATPGSHVRLTVVATGAPPPSYQWFQDGVPIAATSATLHRPNVSAADAGTYTVRVSNGAGSVTSAPATLVISPGRFAGTYFGTFGTGGSFALLVRPDGSGLFLGGTGPSGMLDRSVAVDAAGRVRVTAGPGVRVDAVIDPAAGTVSGTLGTFALTGTRTTGGAGRLEGSYQVAAPAGGGVTYLIVGAGGQAYVVRQDAGQLTAGSAVVEASGRLTGVVGADALAATINGGVLSGTLGPVAVAAVRDGEAAGQRLLNVSFRARVGPASPAALGFVLRGEVPVDVLLRAVGPSLATFGVADALAAPRLDLYGPAGLVATNTGWGTASDPAGLMAGTAQAGAFPLPAGSGDSVLRLRLNPGAYSAAVSGPAPGVGLVEVYDLSAGSAGQRLLNLSTLAAAGSGEGTLIAGVVVAGAGPKRLLVRAVGPSLAVAGVDGVLARPVLAVFSGTTLVGRSSGLAGGAEDLAVAQAAVEVGAFPLTAGAGDAALLINVVPGLYTAQVSSADGGTGLALVEFYEVP